LNPYIKIFTKQGLSFSRVGLLTGLLSIAVKKRIHRTSNSVSMRFLGFKIHSPDYDTLHFLLKEKFVEEEYKFNPDSNAPVIFDCGASIGISLLYFKALLPHARVLAFEPSPRALSYLQKNVTVNNLSDVTLHSLALADKDGFVQLEHAGDNQYLNARTVPNESTSITKAVVQCRRLSSFITQFSKVDLVKIDVEGSELSILNDLIESDVLTRRIVIEYLIEVHPQLLPGDAMLRFVKVFEQNAYACLLVVSEDGSSDVLLRATKIL
jgi:FkbM family methyltransferase